MPVGIRRFWILWFCKPFAFHLLSGCRICTYIVNWVVYGNRVLCHFTIGVVLGFLIFWELRGVSCPRSAPLYTPATGCKLPDLSPDRHTRTAGNVPEFVKVKENEPQNRINAIYLYLRPCLPDLFRSFPPVNAAQSLPLLVVLPPVFQRLDLSFAPPVYIRGCCSYP